MMKPIKSDSNLSEVSAGELTTTDVSSMDDDDHDTFSLASTTSSSSPSSPTISWGPVLVREYERVIATGSASSSVAGVPIGIGWAFVERSAVSIERWESDRIRRDNLKLSSITRKNLLHNVFGYSEEELTLAEKETKKMYKKNRSSTLAAGGDVSSRTKTERVVRGLGEKVKRASWTLLKGFSAASQSATMMSSGMGQHSYY